MPTVGARASVPAAASALEDGYFSLQRLAAYSGLSVRRLRAYMTDPLRPLPCYRVGGRVLVKRSEFDLWMRQFRVANVAASIDALVGDVLAGLKRVE